MHPRALACAALPAGCLSPYDLDAVWDQNGECVRCLLEGLVFNSLKTLSGRMTYQIIFEHRRTPRAFVEMHFPSRKMLNVLEFCGQAGVYKSGCRCVRRRPGPCDMRGGVCVYILCVCLYVCVYCVSSWYGLCCGCVTCLMRALNRVWCARCVLCVFDTVCVYRVYLTRAACGCCNPARSGSGRGPMLGTGPCFSPGTPSHVTPFPDTSRAICCRKSQKVEKAVEGKEAI